MGSWRHPHMFLPVAEEPFPKLASHKGKFLLFFSSKQWLWILILIFPRWLPPLRNILILETGLFSLVLLVTITSLVEHLSRPRSYATCVTHTLPQQPCEAGNFILVYRWGTKAQSVSVNEVAKWSLNLGLTTTLTLPHRLSCFVSKILKGVGSQVPLTPRVWKGRESAVFERLPAQPSALWRAWKLVVKFCGPLFSSNFYSLAT